MLVVVHHGDVEFRLQALLDLEAFRSLDVLQVDASEGGGDGLHRLDEFVRVFLVYLDVEHVDASENLKQQALALHNGLSGQGADVAQAQHGRTI